MIVNTLCIFGTRPEAIKMAPLIKGLQNHALINNKICVTGQHKEMLAAVLNFFAIVADFDLAVMVKEQNLANLTANILTGLTNVIEKLKPDLILVHGDTTSTFAASLAAYYRRIPVAHVEAGLRTGNIYSPWPEELNRKLTSGIAALHFAPTQTAYNNLLQEGIAPETIHVTGNTVVDALLAAVKIIDTQPEIEAQLQRQFPFLKNKRPFILITGHRRENFGRGFEQICHALVKIAQTFPAFDLVYPVHLNPAVQQPVKRLLSDFSNIHLINPVDYLPFVYLMKNCYLILTDSGGIQEEAPSLGKPVLVMRDTTERPEAVAAGTVKLVGTNIDKIFSEVNRLIQDKNYCRSMSEAKNPYGDGYAADRIVDIIAQFGAKEKMLSQAKINLPETSIC